MPVFECRECDTVVESMAASRCPTCGEILAFDGVSLDEAVSRQRLVQQEGSGTYAELLPFTPEGLSEGETPLEAVPRVASELGVKRLFIKQEAANPTGSISDRVFAFVTAAASRAGRDGIMLPSTGDGGESAAAYAAHTGLDARIYVPSRATFVHKAMINVYGSDMRVVEGRYSDAAAAYTSDDDAGADTHGWYRAAPGDSPYRTLGMKPVYCEIVEQLDWTVPDAIIVPAAHGTIISGVWQAAQEFVDVGLVETTPRLYAAQPTGCAPIVTAITDGRTLERWASPDTIVGSLEIPAPNVGERAAAAIRDSGGDAVAIDDTDSLDSVALIAQREGVAVSAAGGVAAAGAREFMTTTALSEDDTVILINPARGSNDADLVRSRLMSHGQ